MIVKQNCFDLEPTTFKFSLVASIMLDPKTIEVRTRSVERTLAPLVKQVGCLFAAALMP